MYKKLVLADSFNGTGNGFDKVDKLYVKTLFIPLSILNVVVVDITLE